MIAASDLPEAIVWHEGMLLAPQHFQQLNRRHEELLYYHARTLAPYHWGVQHLAFDPVLLVNGKLRVLTLEAIMPDGLVVTHGTGQNGDDLEIDLTPYAEELKERALTVHLVVAARQRSDQPLNGARDRYQTHGGTRVVDEITGETEVHIRRMRPQLRLQVEVSQKYVGFPLAKIRYQSEGFALTSYVPPVLSVPKDSEIGKMCMSVVQLLKQKSTFLAEQIRSPSMKMNSPQVLWRHMQIHSMVGALTPFETVLNTSASHPFLLYLTLCGLAGHTAAVGKALVSPDLDPYDHNDLHFSFSQVKAYIERVVQEGIQQTHIAYPFKLRETVYYLPFQEEWFARKLVLGVRGGSGMTEKDVITWIEGCLLGTESFVTSMRERRIRGVNRERVEESDGLVAGPGTVLFEMEATEEFIGAGERLLAFRLDDRIGKDRPAEIVLYVRNE